MTKTTEILTVIKYINNQILIADLRDITISTRKKIAIYGDIVRVLLAPYSATSRELSGAAKASLRLGLGHPLYTPWACSLLPPPSVRLLYEGIAYPTLYHIVLFHRLSL